MDRNTRTLVVLLVAVVMASVASYGVYLAVKSIPERRVEVATAHAVVAVRPLTVGELVTKEDVKVMPWPAAGLVPGSFSSIDQVLNRGLLVSVAENEPLTEAKLAKAGTVAGLSPTIPEGMRAVSVRVNEVVGVAGFVVPGTRVDVLVSLKQAEEAVTRVVVGNVQVLTAGTRFDQENAQKDGKPIPTTVVTLMVTPEDAEKIVLAADEGRIMLTLRNPIDDKIIQSPGVHKRALFGGQVAPQPVIQQEKNRRVARPVVPPPPPPPRVYTVETIRAAKRAEETVR